MTARELVTALIKDGFYPERQSGSHQQYLHPDKRRVTIFFHHPGDTFTPRTLKSMIEKQAKWNEDDLKRLNLLK